MSAEGKRVKRWAPKVFSGCTTCKRRRIKCDETKPTCERCARSNLRCEGYAPPQPRIFVPKKTAARPSRSATTQAETKRTEHDMRLESDELPDMKAVFTDPEDLKCFEYFMKEPAIISAMYSHQHFWMDIIPRAVATQVAVQHSVLALSILYQSLVSIDGFTTHDNQRLVHHYNTAIRDLTQGQPSVDVVLIASILFYSIDFLRHNGHHAAFGHLEAAFNILQEFRSMKDCQTSDYYEIITDHIAPVIERSWDAVTQSGIFNPNETTASLATQFEEATALITTTPQDAIIELQSMVRCLLGYVSQETDISRAEADLATCAFRLPCSFSRLANTANNPQQPPLRGRLFVIHTITVVALVRELKQVLGVGDTLQDEGPSSIYEFMIEQLEEFLAVPSSEAAQRSAPIWNDLGVIAPLFVTIVRSPDEGLADRALRLLRSTNWTEGAWTSGLAASIAEALAQDEVHDSIGLCLNSLEFERRPSSLHIYEDTPEPRFDHYLPLPPEELAGLDLDKLRRIVQCYGYQL